MFSYIFPFLSFIHCYDESGISVILSTSDIPEKTFLRYSLNI